MERFDDIFAALAAPFTNHETKSRSQQGQTFRYAKPRSYKNRLDEVVGGANWQVKAWPANDGAGAWVCQLTITLPDGREVTKTGVGAPGADGSRAHPAKTADSDAFKRACEQFGIGRYFYGDGTVDYGRPAAAAPQPDPAPAPAPDANKAAKLCAWAARQGHVGRLDALARSNYGKDPATLSDEQAGALYKVLEAGTKVSPRPAADAGFKNENGQPMKFGWPKSGAALYAFCKNLEAAFQTSIVRQVDDAFGERSPRGWPRSYKDWTPEQVESAALHVAGLVKGFPGYDGQFDHKLPDVFNLKGEMLSVATQLQQAFGVQEPNRAQLLQAIHSRSADVAGDMGGETIGDFDACADARLLGAALARMKSDLAEAKEYSF